MDHFVGLDVSVKETSVCIVDDTGRIVKEVKAASEPQALLKVLGNPAYRFKRIGLEAGPLSQWLCSGLAEAGLPVVCVETRHMQAVLKAQINKTDRNDARGGEGRWPRMITTFNCYQVFKEITDHGFDESLVRAARKKYPQWTKKRKGKPVSGLADFIEFSAELGGLTAREAFAVFTKNEAWLVRNGLMLED
jgi:hypothetical protein